MPASPLVDMRDPAFRSDPHALLHAVRARGRAERDVVGVWMATHHADCSAGLRSNELSREIRSSPGYAQLRRFIADSTLERTCERWMLLNDPPVHTRLRRLVNAAFKPAVVQALRGRVAAITAELLAALPVADDATFDLMSALAQPLPVRVICDVLGLPADDFARTKQWADALALIVEPVIRRAPSAVAADHAATEMVAYNREQSPGTRASVRKRRPARHAGGGARRRRRQKNERDPVARQPDPALRRRPRDDDEPAQQRPAGAAAPSRRRWPDNAPSQKAMPGAVDEMLRYESSVGMVPLATSSRPMPIGDTVVPAGDVILVPSTSTRQPRPFRIRRARPLRAASAQPEPAPRLRRQAFHYNVPARRWRSSRPQSRSASCCCIARRWRR